MKELYHFSSSMFMDLGCWAFNNEAAILKVEKGKGGRGAIGILGKCYAGFWAGTRKGQVFLVMATCFDELF